MERSYTKSPPKSKDDAAKEIRAKVNSKLPAKENTRPQEFRLHTEQRAVRRAMFNYSVATKLYIMELQKKQVERLQKIIEEEEIKSLRKEMIPRAQLMPYFDRPFFPQRSTRALTIPREPSFHMLSSKCWSCISGDDFYHLHHHHQASNPIQ